MGYVEGMHAPPVVCGESCRLLHVHLDFPLRAFEVILCIWRLKVSLPERLTTTLRKLAHAIFRDFFFFRIKKNETFIGKILFCFNIFSQNIHCGYTLEAPRVGTH